MTEHEQLVEQLDAEIRAIEAADPTETSGAALLRGAKEEIERLQAELEIRKEPGELLATIRDIRRILETDDAIEGAETRMRELAEASERETRAVSELKHRSELRLKAERELAEARLPTGMERPPRRYPSRPRRTGE